MDRLILETSESPDIQIDRIRGALRIKGWDRDELRVDADQEETARLNSTENQITLDCDSGCMLRAPMESSIDINRIDGELMLISLEGQIKADTVSGKVMAKSIGSLSIKKIASNLNARNLEGSLECQQVTGNVNLQDVQGKIQLNNVNGNLVIKGYSTGIHAETKGNATLRLDPEPGNKFIISAGGNINCRLTPESNIRLILRSGAKNIRVNSEGTEERLRIAEHEITIGEGDGEMILEAGGIIDFSIPTNEDQEWAFEFDFENDVRAVAGDISQIVTDQIEIQLESLGDHLSSLSKNLASIPATSDKTRRKLEAKRQQLERKLARLERKTSYRARQAAQKTRATRSRYSYRKTASEPISDEERQQVLTMLQNKQITVQEAEILLAALEGREPETPTTSQSTGEKADSGNKGK